MRVGLSFLLLLLLVNQLLGDHSETDIKIESFFDGFISAQLLSQRIPGAALAIVRGGDIVLCKGYGVADLRTGRPVRARQTLFRMASLSKPIVFTAAMQLVENGTLSLHSDVNGFLKTFKISKPFGKEITLAHLMTHTAGFEDTYFRQWSQDMNKLPTLGEYLKRNRPACIRPPGETFGYSNYGASLAGYLIESSTGTPYEDYLEENIFKPLGMHNTTARQPLPKRMQRHMAVSYRNGRPIGFELILDSPAGAITSTAEDMAKFMMAHLGWGPGKDPILSEESFNAMHERQFGHHPLLDGHTFGFVHEVINGEHVISHSGAMVAFRTRMILLPDSEIGLFVAYNSDSGSLAGRQLKGVFLDRCFPKRQTPAAPPFLRSANATKGLPGWYRKTRYSHTSAAKIAGLLGAAKKLTTKGSKIHFLDSWWFPIGPDLYEENVRAEYPRRLAFNRSPGSRPDFVYVGVKAFERLEWYETPTLHWFLFLLFQFAFVSSLVKAIWSSSSRSRVRRSPFLPAKYDWCKITIVITSALNLALALALYSLLLGGMKSPVHIFYGLPWWVVIPSTGTLISAVLAPMTLLLIIHSARNGRYGTMELIHNFTVVIAANAFIWWLHYWNLLGFKY